MIKKMISYVKEYKLPTLLTFLFLAGEAVIECLIPFRTVDLLNSLKNNVQIKTVLTTGVILIIMALVSLACGVAAGYTSAKASAGFAKNIRRAVFDKIQSFSFENIDKFSSSSLVTRMTTDVNNVQMSYLMIIRSAVRSPLMLIFSIIMSYRMGGPLSSVFVIVIPFLAGGLFLVAKLAMPAFRKVFKKYDKLNQSIEENVRGVRVVKGFSRQEYEKEKFGTAAEEIRDNFTKADRIVAFNHPIMQICLYFVMIFVLSFGSYLVISSRGSSLDVGHISAMLTYGMQILMSLMMLSMVYVIITISIESIKRIAEVLDEESTLKNPENPVMQVKDGSIDFENVSFKYSKKSKKYALADVDLHIKSGMTVGIIGGTGSSKSTLVQLVPRLYDVSVGSIKVGGIDVREYDLKVLRDNVAMVLQKNQLFSGSVKDNIRWGNQKATDKEVIEVCKLAQAHEFITSFSDGYDSYIEQGGTNVSGGQKQRLCIARALLKRPKILILDDSTSAVDTKTDALIRKAFKEYIPETTKLIIAQRISSVQDADMIIIMENGKIDDMGTHEELLQSSSVYRAIYEQQKGGRSDGNEA